MTDGLSAAGDDKRDDGAPATSPAPQPAATSAFLTGGTDALAAQIGDNEAKDGVASTADEVDAAEEGVSDEDDTEEEEEEDEDEEPRLKYARLTPHLGAVYRNGDATSSFLVAGDKKIVGSHNGNIVSIEHAPATPVPPVNRVRSMSYNCRSSSRFGSTTLIQPL
jgi:hemin uptake protein HemP